MNNKIAPKHHIFTGRFNKLVPNFDQIATHHHLSCHTGTWIFCSIKSNCEMYKFLNLKQGGNDLHIREPKHTYSFDGSIIETKTTTIPSEKGGFINKLSRKSTFERINKDEKEIQVYVLE